MKVLLFLTLMIQESVGVKRFAVRPYLLSSKSLGSVRMQFRLILAVGALLFSHLHAQGQHDSLPLVQPTVPHGWTESSFEERFAEPECSPSERSRGYMVFSRPITKSIYLNSRPRHYERVEMISGFATPGEFEPITFALYPLRDLGDISVHCSDLFLETERIPASAVDVRLVTYWNIRYPRYNSEGTYRRLPELLEKVDSVSIKKGECHRWWLTLHVPADTKAGLYRGTITIREKGEATAVELPVLFRVMDFTLKRDPHKRLSAYYYPRDTVLYQGLNSRFIDRATANNYRAMVEHGLNMFPTFQLSLDSKTKEIVIQHEAEIARMRAAGLEGPLPVDGSNAIQQIIQWVVPGFEAKPHWVDTENIPPRVYPLIEQKFRQFVADCRQKGLPELCCCPLDEIAPDSQRFGVEVYAALKRAGIRTFATKNPLAPDANRYAPYVDVWCSQPFALSFEAVTSSKHHEYWSYPNHNTGELKDREIMCQGGRMTYGYGFWRSGFTTLIPWHWSWALEPDPFDYLRGSQAGCGQRIDPQGNVIPAVYWECFREGFDDGRYLYSLQQAIWEREGATDPLCQKLKDAAKGLLQQIWNSIDVQDRYLSAGIWSPQEFEARRWQIALLVEQLQKFPITRQGVAPSVYVENVASSVRSSKSEDQLNRDRVEIMELADNVSKWNAESDESVLRKRQSTSEQSEPLNWTVSIDHQKTSEADGDYKTGWPRIRRNFARGELDFTKYDSFEIELTFDSSRDEVQNDSTLLGICFSSFNMPKHHEFEYDLGGSQRRRTRLVFPVKELIDASGHGPSPWKSIDYVQLFISEANYSDKTKLSFDIHNVRLLRLKEPQIVSIDLPRVILLPARYLNVRCDLVGIRTEDETTDLLTARVLDKSGNAITDASTAVATVSTVVLDTAGMTSGNYQLEFSIPSRHGNSVKKRLSFQCVDGPSQAK
jgi:hypothetical protein